MYFAHKLIWINEFMADHKSQENKFFIIKKAHLFLWAENLFSTTGSALFFLSNTNLLGFEKLTTQPIKPDIVQARPRSLIEHQQQ